MTFLLFTQYGAIGVHILSELLHNDQKHYIFISSKILGWCWCSGKCSLPLKILAKRFDSCNLQTSNLFSWPYLFLDPAQHQIFPSPSVPLAGLENKFEKALGQLNRPTVLWWCLSQKLSLKRNSNNRLSHNSTTSQCKRLHLYRYPSWGTPQLGPKAQGSVLFRCFFINVLLFEILLPLNISSR